MFWARFREFRELEKLVRENPDYARLFDREGNFDVPVPWWQENHQGLKKRVLLKAYHEGR
jgi:uncharacterized protein YdcH (DUF465 family)